MKGYPKSISSFACIGIVLITMLSCGCASWSKWDLRGSGEDSKSTRDMPLKRVSRAVELDTEFIQIKFDPADPDQLQSLWQWVDETVLAADVRSELTNNGLRIGKVVQPDRLLGRIDSLRSDESADVVDDFLTSAAVASHQSEGEKTIPMRVGRRYELPVRMPIQGDQLVIVDDQPQPVGRNLFDPQFLLAITPHSGRSAGELRFRIRPEVQHGDMRQDWVKGEAALRIDVRRESWSLDSMEFELTGSEGDLFVISEAAVRKGIGRQMFGGKTVDQLEQQTILLIRIGNIPTPAEKL